MYVLSELIDCKQIVSLLLVQAGFLEGVTNIVPGKQSLIRSSACAVSVTDGPGGFFVALGGVNLKQLMDDAADEVGGKLLLDFKDTAGDRIQVFLE